MTWHEYIILLENYCTIKSLPLIEIMVFGSLLKNYEMSIIQY